MEQICFNPESNRFNSIYKVRDMEVHYCDVMTISIRSFPQVYPALLTPVSILQKKSYLLHSLNSLIEMANKSDR